MGNVSQKPFWNHEDTPLFSGVASSVTDHKFDPKPKVKQDTLGFTCTVCFDTGKVGDKFCNCKRGIHERSHKDQS